MRSNLAAAHVKMEAVRSTRKTLGSLTAIGICGLLLSGCASVPDVSPAVGHASVAQKPKIVTRSRALSSAEIKDVVARLTLAPGDNALLQHHLAIEQAVADAPLVAGETAHILRDGPATFRAMFAAIRSAKRRIDLEYYIFENVESDGVHLADLLLAKRAEGVAINIIYDDYGSGSTPQAFFDQLKSAGCHLVEFNPMNPLKAKAGWKPNSRDHRKILIVDGATAIVGGINLATEYQSNPIGKSGNSDEQAGLHWRDTDLIVTGPAVAQLEKLFEDHWNIQQGPPLAELEKTPPVPGQTGNAVVRFVGSAPGRDKPHYYVTLISSMRSAEKSITASAAYFVPTKDERRALMDASRRGVDVTLILPDKSDSGLSIAVAHSHYGKLLRAGVKIYETHGIVLHSKTVAVDGVWSMIGSSNFDHRSVVFNDEVDAVVIGSETADELDAIYAQDRATATQVDYQAWKHRPLGAKFKEMFASLLQNFL
jgi:cardiolipin synthase